MSNEASRAYFKSQGWPSKMNGDLKAVADLDKGELIAIARKYAIMLQTEYAQIVPGYEPHISRRLRRVTEAVERRNAR